MRKIRVLVGIILSIFTSLCIVLLCFSLVINILGYRSNIANEITGDKIKEVQLGMPLEQVISILGKPYHIETDLGLHILSCKNPKPMFKMKVKESTDIISIVDSIFNDTNYCCEGNKEDIQRGKRATLTYTKPVRFSEHYAMLWVHLDSNYCVRCVYAKQYEFIMGNVCIYSLSWKTDKTTLEKMPGEVYINEELFNNCFKNEIDK